MSRLSNDQVVDGKVLNGFDYDLQVWVINGIIQRCGHPEAMNCGCMAKVWAGRTLIEAIAYQDLNDPEWRS